MEWNSLLSWGGQLEGGGGFENGWNDDIATVSAELESALKRGDFTLNQFVAYFEEETNRIQNIYYQKYTHELAENLKRRIDEENRSKEGDLFVFKRWLEYVKKWFACNNDFGNVCYQINHQETIKILNCATSKFIDDKLETLES